MADERRTTRYDDEPSAVEYDGDRPGTRPDGERPAHRKDLSAPTRRAVLRGATALGVAGLSGVGLIGCGGGSTTAGGGTSATPTGEASRSAASSQPASGEGGALAKTSEIPVGGGKVFPNEKIVVTQPVAGRFKAFTAVCTHKGCTVGSVSGGTINCPCHGSKYSIQDGSVKGGPAPAPLAAKQVTVKGEEIIVS